MKQIEVNNSIKGYLIDIEELQYRHLPIKKRYEITGIKSNDVKGLLQIPQCEPGEITDSPLGIL